MKTAIRQMGIAVLIAVTVTPIINSRAADSAERAQATKGKIQALRAESAKIRYQVELTLDELNRLNVKGVELRPQFDKFKADLVKMEEQAQIARGRADSMRAKGQASFEDWEKEVQDINNPKIRKEAEKRYSKRQKSYTKILTSIQEAKEHLVPFMSDLNDIHKLLNSELTETSVASTKSTIRTANKHGGKVNDSLRNVEKELDRVSADFAKYQ